MSQYGTASYRELEDIEVEHISRYPDSPPFCKGGSLVTCKRMMSSASEGPLTAVSDQKESTVSQTVRKPRVNLMIQGYLSGRVVVARRVDITNIALKLTSLILR